MNLFTRLTRSDGEERAFAPITLDQWANYFSFNGNDYVVQGGTPSSKGEPIEANFQGYVQGAYKSNGVVFACMAARQLLFSEARFQFRQLRGGRPGDLFGSTELAILEITVDERHDRRSPDPDDPGRGPCRELLRGPAR
jgi:hypothetical protein